MIIDGSFRVNAPAAEVWDFLIDFDQVSRCVPGLEEAREEGGGCYYVVVKAKVAFMTANIHLHVEITESEPPFKLKSRFMGVDKKLGSSIKQTNVMELVHLDPAITEVRYESDVTFLGRLGTIGRPIIKAKAAQLMKDFSAAVKSRIERAG